MVIAGTSPAMKGYGDAVVTSTDVVVLRGSMAKRYTVYNRIKYLADTNTGTPLKVGVSKVPTEKLTARVKQANI